MFPAAPEMAILMGFVWFVMVGDVLVAAIGDWK